MAAYPYKFPNTYSEQDTHIRSSNAAISNDSTMIDGAIDFSRRSGQYDGEITRPDSGSQSQSGWSWQSCSQKPTSARIAQGEIRSPQPAYVPAQNQHQRSHIEQATIQLPPRRELISAKQQLHGPYQMASAPPAVFNRQIENRYSNMSCSKMRVSEWLPSDLLHVQPLQQTMTIEDMVQYELAVAGTFELCGSDMDSLYTLAGL